MWIIGDSIVYDLATVVIFSAICVYFFLTWKFNYWKERGVAYIKPVPFFGSLKDQMLGRKNPLELYQGFYDELKGNEFGGFFELRSPALLVRDPKLVERILIKDFDHFYNRSFPPLDEEKDPLSSNLFNLQDSTWRNLRYKLIPTFSTGKLKGMFDQISNCGGKLVKFIEDESKINGAIESKPLLSSFAFELVGSVAFGLQFDKDNEANKNFHRVVSSLFQPSALQILRFVLMLYMPGIRRRFGIKQFPQEVDDVVLDLVRSVLKYRTENNVIRKDFLQLLLNLRKLEKESSMDFQKDHGEYHPDDDVIDQMKHASKLEDDSQRNQQVFMTDTCIAAQCFVFFIAGSESVSTTINFGLYSLSQNPKIQEKIHAELDSVLARHNNQWTFQAVKEMVYLEQVIQETLRLYPSAGFLMRICSKPYKIPETQVVIDKGVRVLIPLLAIQNDPENYDSPEEFDPDRFKDNNFKPSGTYLPFGDGPRICIAMRFAVLEVKVVMARILSHYNVKLSEKTKLPFKFKKRSFILQPENGFWFEFDKREKL